MHIGVFQKHIIIPIEFLEEVLSTTFFKVTHNLDSFSFYLAEHDLIKIVVTVIANPKPWQYSVHYGTSTTGGACSTVRLNLVRVTLCESPNIEHTRVFGTYRQVR